jgi:cytidylate kinase
MRKIITINGLAASGKGTIARTFAKKYGWRYVDMGIIFRAIAYAIMVKKAKTIKEAGMKIKYLWKDGKTEILLNGKNILKDITTPTISMLTAKLSSDEGNLKEMSKIAEKIADIGTDFICDGRNAGTTIFPEANIKIFVYADIRTRAKRRQEDNEKLGFKMKLGDVLNLLVIRDRIDSERNYGKAEIPKEAVRLNTDALSPDESADLIWSFVKK